MSEPSKKSRPSAALDQPDVLGIAACPLLGHPRPVGLRTRRPTAGMCACGRTGAARGRNDWPSSATSRTVLTCHHGMNGWADPEPAWRLNLRPTPTRRSTSRTPPCRPGSCRRSDERPRLWRAGRVRQGCRWLCRPAVTRDRYRHPVAPTRGRGMSDDRTARRAGPLAAPESLRFANVRRRPWSVRVGRRGRAGSAGRADRGRPSARRAVPRGSGPGRTP